MRTINGKHFTFHLGDEFVIFELDEGVDELSREKLESMSAMLAEAYEEPYGMIFVRANRVGIDLLAARDLMKREVQNLVAVANVTADPTTRMAVEYEKTVIDQIPVESFDNMSEAIRWISGIVREKRSVPASN